MWAIGLLTLAQVTTPPLAPADAVRFAHADLARLPAASQPYYRYLSLYHVPPTERAKIVAVLNGHCNGLSREPDLTPVTVVPGSQLSLVRVNLQDYVWSTATWEKLVDPYFTVSLETTVDIPWAGGIWPGDGKHYAANTFTVTHKKKVVQALAPWLTEGPNNKLLGDIVTWTQSKIPIVRYDWFLNQTSAAVDRVANYYDFLGIKSEKDYQSAIGADVALAKRLNLLQREAVGISGVTLHARAIVRVNTIIGGYWRTLDFKDNKNRKNPLRILGEEIEAEVDAVEAYGHLPNGLWAMGAFDGKGAIQKSVPDDIASDSRSKSNDRRIHPAVSCVRCHTNGGLQDIDGWAKNLLTKPFDLLSPDYERARSLRREYLRDLEQKLVVDRAIYEGAIKAITGLDSKAYAAAYASVWESYEDAKLDLNQTAAELGTTPQKWRAALDAKVKAGTGDTVLSVLLLENQRLNRIPRPVWEELFPEANATLRGVIQP